MNIISTFVTQVVQTFSVLPGGRKLLFILLCGGSVAGLGWLMMQASTGGYTPILTQSTLQETGAALSKLSQMKIPAKTEANGTTLLVSANRQDEAMMLLAMEGIYDRGAVGNELLDRSGFGDSKFKQEKNYLRMREGEMARTLMTLSEVESARVHLALPDTELFVKDTPQAKASVVVRLRIGQRLTERQVSGIVNLVSHGVEGLQPENVSVIDSNGNILNRTSPSDAANATGENLNFKTQAEERIRTEVEKMLEKTVGRDKVIASVQMDFDFSRLKSTQTIYNPKDQDPIIQTEKTVVEQETSSKAASDSGTATTGPAGSAHNDTSKSYAVSQTVEETAQSVPTLKRMTVGVLVDGIYDEAKGADGKVTKSFRARTPQEMDSLKKVVEAVIGYNTDTRQDVVEVSCVPFQSDPTEVVASTWLTPEIRQIIQLGVQWGVVALIGLLLILMVLKPAMKQITVTTMTQRSLPAGASAGAGGGHGHAGVPGGDGLTPEQLLTLHQRDGKLLALQENNKIASDGSQMLFREVQSEARSNPQRTVSMIRQWMEEG